MYWTSQRFGGLHKLFVLTTCCISLLTACGADDEGASGPGDGLPVEPMLVAFPGAEGHGKHTLGGRGGAVYAVTHLGDSGPGSLREAVNAEGPRTVIFRTSGTIDLQSELKITNPFITIAGQTAPGDGIALKRYPLVIAADEVIVRHVRVRLGDESGGASDAVSSRYFKNIVIDHVSASWSVDETLSLYFCENLTVQWSIISESLYMSNHDKGVHGYGGIWGGNHSTYHHNLIAHHTARNPRFTAGSGHTDFRNNVIYNWAENSSHGGGQNQESDERFNFTTINMVANYYKPGPATQAGEIQYRIVAPERSIVGGWGQWFVEGNVVEGNAAVTADNWNGGVQPDETVDLLLLKMDMPWPAEPITEHTAQEALVQVLANAGATLPKRDAVDARIVDEVQNGYATYEGATYKSQLANQPNENIGIIDTPADVGGWPELLPAAAPEDTDLDGIPDDWELQFGLDPNNAEDRNTLYVDGYTFL